MHNPRILMTIIAAVSLAIGWGGILISLPFALWRGEFRVWAGYASEAAYGTVFAVGGAYVLWAIDA